MRAIGASKNITIPSSTPVPLPPIDALQKPPLGALDASGVGDAIGEGACRPSAAGKDSGDTSTGVSVAGIVNVGVDAGVDV